MYRIPQAKHEHVVRLRMLGKSIPEISLETGVPRTTVLRHIAGVEVPQEYRQILREKQGGSKDRALALRQNLLIQAEKEIGVLSKRDYFLLLVGLYWGEGTKRDLSVINSDPTLIQTILRCLRSIGVRKEKISFSLRVHDDISLAKSKRFWARVTRLSESRITRVEVIKGKKKGKLPYGMCRVRVSSGIRERLLIQSTISLVGKRSATE